VTHDEYAPISVRSLAFRSRTTALLFGATVVAWAVTVVRMRGMHAGPGTDLGGLGWYLGFWVTMTAAMMLPSVAPAARHAARLARRRPCRSRPRICSLTTAWRRPLPGRDLLDLGWLAWDRGGPYLAGGVIVGAGHELTLLKQLSPAAAGARSPRSPLRSGLVHGPTVWLLRRPDGGAVRAGRDEHLLMAVVAAAIFAEKVLPRGDRLSRMLALALVVLGIWIAFSASSVPGLTEPGGSPSMEMSQ
jgi:hypothetical protein